MGSILKPEKNRKADLERRRFLYFEIGLLLVLCVLFAAFNWPAPKEDFYFSPPKKDTAFYVAQEVYMFKPLPETPQVVKKAQAVKQKVVKQTPVAITPVVTQPIVTPVIEQPKPDTASSVAKGTNTNNNPLPPNLIWADKKPQFPGGEAAMRDYLTTHLKYPIFARKNNYSGTIYLKFMVGVDGKLFDIKVEKGVRNSGLNEEVIQVFAAMPPWEPGFRNGRPVPFLVAIPVPFEFEN